MNWIVSLSRVDDGAIVGSCRITRLLFRTVWGPPETKFSARYNQVINILEQVEKF